MEGEEIKKVLRLPKLEYYETHLSIMNCILPVKMTPMEIEVLACFMALEGDIANYRFGPSGRKIVMQEKKLSPAGLSNYITSFLRKGILTKSGDMLTIFPILFPSFTQQDYRLRLIKNSDGN